MAYTPEELKVIINHLYPGCTGQLRHVNWVMNKPDYITFEDPHYPKNWDIKANYKMASGLKNFKFPDGTPINPYNKETMDKFIKQKIEKKCKTLWDNSNYVTKKNKTQAME